jgi:hypothetical protein
MTTELGSNIPAPELKAKTVTKPKTVRIVLEENDNIPPTGLFVGENGRGYLIRAGEEVDVPAGIVEILTNATQAVPTVDPQSLQVVGYREKSLYPFRIVQPR